MIASATSLIVRPNVGVIFVQRDVPPLAQLHWHHTIAIPLNLTISPPEKVSPCTRNDTTVCPAIRQLHSLYHQASDRVTTELMNTKDQIVHLLSKPSSRHNKRGWLNIIGKGAKTFFGVATEADINILKQHIAKLQTMVKDNNGNRVTDIKQLHSFQLHASKRMDGLADHLATIDDVLINMTYQFQTMNQFARQFSNLSEMVIQQQYILGETFNYMSYNSHSHLQLTSLIETYNLFQALLHDIPHLVNGKLTPNIISPLVLTQLLKDVENNLQSLNSHMHVQCDNSYFYMHDHATITTLKNDVIYLKLRIPIASTSYDFALFKVDVVPVPANTNQSMFTKVSNVPPYLLISKDQEHFLELSSNDLDNINDPAYPRTLVPMSRSNKVCVLNLFFDQVDMLTENCKLDLIHSPSFPQNFIYSLGQDEYLIYSPKLTWTVSCPSQLDKSVQHLGLFTIQLKCRCTLRAQSTLLTAVDKKCFNAQHVVNYSVNWFVYQALYKSAMSKPIVPSILHSQPINFQLPSFAMNISKLKQMEKLDHASNKHALEIFNISESHSSSTDFIDWSDLQFDSDVTILAIIFGCINLILSLALAYVFLRLRMVQQLVISAAATTNPVDALHLTLPPTSTPVTPMPASILPQINFSLIILILTTALLTILFLLYRKRKQLCLCVKQQDCHSNPQCNNKLYPNLHDVNEMHELSTFTPSAPAPSTSPAPQTIVIA